MSTTACSSSSSNGIQLFVRTMSGKPLVLHVNANDTIGSIHEKIHSATGVHLSIQRLFYGSTQLESDYTLFHYNITNDSTLHLVARMQGTTYIGIHRLLYLIRQAQCFFSACNRKRIQKLLVENSLLPLFYPNVHDHSGLREALVKLYISPYDAVLHDDPLYIFCRTSLGSILNSTNIFAVQDIIPYVDELAAKLSHGLVSSMDSTGPSSNDVQEFKLFFRYMVNTDIHSKVLEKQGYVYSLYLILFEKMQACLTKMEDDIEVISKVKRDNGWDQYLPILSQLYHVAKLYEGEEEIFLTSLRPYKVAVCYLTVRYAKSGDDDYKWILNCKELTGFETRRHLVLMLLPEVTRDYQNSHKMFINRSNLLAESFESITGADPDSLHGISIWFKNEKANGPGVLREWFMFVCLAIFNPQNALFLDCPGDGRRFFPNPASEINPGHLEYYRFTGRMIALALMHKMQVGIAFARAFCKQLAGNNVSLEDIKDADPYLYKSCMQILEMDSCVVDQDVLGLTFTWEFEELGVKKVVELEENGKQIGVNSENREKYVNLIIKHQFVTSIAKQLSHFREGFAEIVGTEENMKLCFEILELEYLDRMLCGSESDISVDDWEAHTQYKGYKENDPQIYWFWKIVREMSVEQRQILLFFWTSMKYLPVEGFHGLASKLYIIKSDEEYERLPSSHTCFYQICIPAYPSMAVMQERLNIITQEYVGFSFGTD